MAYSKKQLEAAWVRNGGKKELASTMAAIAGAESGFGANPYGDKGLGAPGYTSFGPWQIHTPAHPQYSPGLLVSNLDYSARAAVEVSGNSTAGLGNWTTYKTGAYKKYSGGGSSPTLLSTIFGGEVIPGEGKVEGILDNFFGNPPTPSETAHTVEGAVSGVGSAITSTADVLKALTEPETWLRVAEAVGGMVLLAMGLKTLTRGSGTAGPLAEAGRQARSGAGVARKAAKVAAVA